MNEKKEQFTEEMFEEVDMTENVQYCLTEIPDLGDLGDIGQYAEDVEFTPEFWKMVAENMRKEHERYVKQCEAMCIDPESGKSTMSWEERNKMFTM